MTGEASDREPFAGGDQHYLKTEQYGDGEKLGVRVRLHREFSTATEPLSAFEARLTEWPTGADVLECGCGTGMFWASDATPKAIRLTLTDLSPGMVDEAASRAAANGYEVADQRSCDVQDLPFDDDSFDIVVANHMLYHVPDPDRGLGEIARVLRPGGTALIATNGYGHMDLITEIVTEVFGDYSERLYEVFGIDSGERRLRRHFSSITWNTYANDLVVDDPRAIVDYVLSFPPGEHADEGQRAGVERAVDRRFDEALRSTGERQVTVSTRTGAFVCSQRVAPATAF